MELREITRKLLDAKNTTGLTFADLGKVVGRDEVWVAALCYRQASASQEEAIEVRIKNGTTSHLRLCFGA